MSVNKHAYLIIAHANFYVLEKLILMIDDARNDIYIHIDKKTKSFDFHYFETLAQRSNVKFVERKDVRWGHVSQIAVELLLFRSAFVDSGASYSYFHLLSGVDLPIKSQDYIHSFFERNHGKEFIGFSNAQFDEQRITKIHLFAKNMKAQDGEPLKRLARKVRLLFISLQNKAGYNKCSAKIEKFVYGSNWVSVTSHFVEELLKEEKWFLQFYKYSNCGDEIYKHTFAYNTPFFCNVYDKEDELRSNMRYMDWKRGRPYTFRIEDLDDIMSSDRIFVRKIEDTVDFQIATRIYEEVLRAPQS